ncbi:sodium-independent sulfate anion transporter-like isoform X4 [Lineus longissimus]|uniref:sodium-independent sulfate anion transporter-like isoform X4 n=1 Tax=Lineus longissimus TaxID=88925 RepID=UPI00315D0139
MGLKKKLIQRWKRVCRRCKNGGRINQEQTEGLLGDQEKAENDVNLDDNDTDDEEGPHCCLTLKEMACNCERCKVLAKDFCSAENAKKKFPIVQWLPKYRLDTLQCDVIAGLTVGLMVIPQGLAYAQVADLPQQYGLYSAFVGCFIYCFLGTSKDITLGPTAIMSLMTAAFAKSPVKDDATYAIVLCLMTGLIQFVMGVFHLGFLVRFISHPVISGFTTAAAITIAIGQLKYILGLQNISREFLHMVYDLCVHIPETRWPDVVMGITCFVILVFMKKMKDFNCYGPEEDMNKCQKVGRYLIWLLSISRNALLVIVSALLVYGLSLHEIKPFIVTGDLKPGLPPFKPPAFSVVDYGVNGTGNGTTYTAGDIFSSIGTGFFIVPILGLVETIAIGKAFARKNNYKLHPSQELIAIGIANIAGSFVGSYPVTGSFSRTAVNSQSGVKTPLGGIFTGALVMLALAFLTPWFYYIPKATLGAVIIAAVIQMVDFGILKKMWKVRKLDLIPWGFTFLFSFLLGIEYGILIGIGVNLLMLLFSQSRPSTIVINKEIVVVQFELGITFPAIDYVASKLNKVAFRTDPPKNVIIDCSHLSTIDYSSIHGFHEILEDFYSKDVTIVFACLKTDLLDTFLKSELPHFRHAGTITEAWTMIEETHDVDAGQSLLGSDRLRHVTGSMNDADEQDQEDQQHASDGLLLPINHDGAYSSKTDPLEL